MKPQLAQAPRLTKTMHRKPVLSFESAIKPLMIITIITANAVSPARSVYERCLRANPTRMIVHTLLNALAELLSDRIIGRAIESTMHCLSFPFQEPHAKTYSDHILSARYLLFHGPFARSIRKGF